MATRKPPAGMRPRPSQAEIQGLVDLFKSGDHAETERRARKLLISYPDNSILYNMLGAAQTAQKKFEVAIGCLERSIKLEPRHAGSYNNLGMALRGAGRLDEAVEQFAKAYKIKPDYHIARNNHGDTLMQANRHLDAVASYRALLRERPGMLDVYVKLGSALRELGKPDEAIDVYEQALDIKFDNFAVHNNLGNVLSELGRCDEAASAFRQALRYNPSQSIAHYNLHALQLAEDSPQAAIDSLTTAYRYSPSETTLELFLAVTLDYAGQTEKAQEIMGRQARWSDLDRARLEGWNYLKAAGRGQPRLLGNPNHIFMLAAEAAELSGQVLEFGVRFGNSIRQLAELCDQQIHGFDSFQGLPEAWDDAPQGEYSTRGVLPTVPRNVQLHVGWFADTLPPFVADHKEPVRLANIDCDIYSSTKTVLTELSAQIVPGTVLVFDEYIGNVNWREDEYKAFQEFIVDRGLDYEYLACSLYTKQVVVRIKSN